MMVSLIISIHTSSVMVLGLAEAYDLLRICKVYGVREQPKL